MTIRRNQDVVRWVTVTALALFWIALPARLVPNPAFEDTGVFLSVADRLVAGDVLYAGVWDNKDPLFYLTLALGRAITPYAPTVLEVGWMICASLASWLLALHAGCGRDRSVLLGFLVAPLILTGSFYAPGYSHLPGEALTLLALALALGRRYAAAGVIAGLVPFFKIVLGPVALVVLAAVLVRRGGAGVRGVLAGAAASLASVVALLAARRELGPYLDSLRLNVAYADETGGGVQGHVSRILAVPGAWLVLLTVLAVLLLTLPRARRRAAPGGTGPLDLWLCAATSLAAALAILAATGLWYHHLQVLYVPAVLCSIAFATAFGRGERQSSMAGLAVSVCAGLVLGGASPTAYARALLAAPEELRLQAAVSPLSRSLLASGPAGTYARVGAGDHDAHAHGLAEWHLACARFHQYPFDPEWSLMGVADCLPRADAIMIEESAVAWPGATTWNAFLARVDALVGEGYTCEIQEAGRLCRKVAR